MSVKVRIFKGGLNNKAPTNEDLQARAKTLKVGDSEIDILAFLVKRLV